MPSSNFVASARGVLVIGATSGIGRAIAEKFASSEGKQVVACGRRQEKLDELSKQEQNISTAQLDVTDLKNLRSKIDEIFKAHTSINTVFLVSGLQRTSDFTKPTELDFEKVALEVQTNYTAYAATIAAVLPHLEKQPQPMLAVVSSQLALLPNTRTAVYNGTKAGVHMLLLSIRQQMKEKSNISIVELYPPSTATELHAKHNQPDLPDDYKEMPLEDYIHDTWQGLQAGKLDIPVGGAVEPFEKVELERYKLFQ